ncbi:hypothetical protein OF83DRAFT_1172247 [Amylostereum chailletii]|nr:hypothetical protein OF83DRAFT_1172247 [Amylostereum chailletii]
MPFGLTIGTERADILQKAIQDELVNRRYGQEPDAVMAEYITIMIINNKSAEQISNELEDLIGPEFDSSFTDWLFAEAAKGEQPNPPVVISEPTPTVTSLSSREPPPHVSADSTRRNPPSGPRSGAPLYQQALSQATSSTSPTAQKRTASARSPSPGGHGPNKARRTDVPIGPRAMLREGRHPAPSAPRSLLERVGGPARNANGFPRDDDVQQRFNGMPDPNMMGGFPPNMSEMDMNALAAAQMSGANPMMLQEMMMNQMALMAQMASSLGMINPGMMGFPMQGGMQEMGMMGAMDSFQGPGNHQIHMDGGAGRGRGNGRGFGNRGRGGNRAPGSRPTPSEEQRAGPSTTASQAIVSASVPASTPTPVAPTPEVPQQGRPAFAIPERPQSPTLCKFGLKCTNAHCRWSHPSPVATAESGVVLSNEACEQGKNCKDKDCIRAHVSPAVANPSMAVEHKPHTAPAPAPPPSHVPVQCRYGASCTRRDCTFQHPSNHHLSKPASQVQQCRFGAGCTRANCTFQHPDGRVLPGSFHRGLSSSTPLVNVPAPATGSMGVPSHHRSVVFNSAKGPDTKESLEKKMKEIEEEKSKAQKAVKDAQDASKKDSATKPAVAIAA